MRFETALSDQEFREFALGNDLGLGVLSTEVSLPVRVLGDCEHPKERELESQYSTRRRAERRRVPSEAFEEGTVNFSGREAGSGVRNLAGRGLPDEDSLSRRNRDNDR